MNEPVVSLGIAAGDFTSAPPVGDTIGPHPAAPRPEGGGMMGKRIGVGLQGLCIVAAGHAAAGTGLAQCAGQWVTSASGFNGVVRALVSWDPDGGGPGAAVLVAAGDFITAGAVSTPHIAQWNGSAWQGIG